MPKHFLFFLFVFAMSCEDAYRPEAGDECKQSTGHGSFPLPNTSDLCSDGLRCVNSICVPIVGIGHACDCVDGVCEASCKDGTFCDTRKKSPVCIPHLNEGDICAGSNDGEDYLFPCTDLICNQAYEPSTCRPKQKLGGSCTQNYHCKSLSGCIVDCVQRRCEAIM